MADSALDKEFYLVIQPIIGAAHDTTFPIPIHEQRKLFREHFSCYYSVIFQHISRELII